jgi:hypothetical protein
VSAASEPRLLRQEQELTMSRHTTNFSLESAFFSSSLILVTAALAAGCGSSGGGGPAPGAEVTQLSATIGPQGGEIVGAQGTKFEGVHIVVPAGALAADTPMVVRLATDDTKLPVTALACGPAFAIEPQGLALASPATVTLPFDENVVEDNQRFDDEVKVWAKDGDHFTQKKQIDGAPGTVTFELSSLTSVAAGVNPPLPADIVKFHLVPNPKFAKCLAAYPDDPSRAPSADVVVVRGDLTDSLTLRASNLKEGLKFDMFTVQHTSLKADGTPDPAFTNFGLAWYQSDVDVRDGGHARVNVRSVLLDQIFGFDPAATLPPTGTFHVGFWFNDPNDAAPCGFNVAAPTPFNGDHAAGPLAMISLPDAKTDLGPLCTKADTSTTPARCSP